MACEHEFSSSVEPTPWPSDVQSLTCSRPRGNFGRKMAQAHASARRRRFAGPALVRMRERARFLETQEPGNVSDRKAPVFEITFSELGPHLIEHLCKGKTLRRKPARQCAGADAEVLGDPADARLAMRQKRQNRVLHGGFDRAPAAGPPSQGRFPIAYQGLVEVRIGARNT